VAEATADDASEAVTASVGDVAPEPDVVPDLAEQPPTAVEDQPVLPAEEPAPSLVGEAAPAAVIPVTADAPETPAEAPEAAPKRRRRATSRPAGPPSVSV
jgi:hypothetical protein